MNWLKRIFCSQEEFVAHIEDPVARKDTFEVKEPKKNKNIPETKCMWDSIPVEDRMKPMGLSCPCRKCSTYC